MRHLNEPIKKLNPIVKRRLLFEKKLISRNIAIILIFLFAWTPYALVSMYSAFIDPNGITPEFSLVPSMLAKSSFAFTPLMYMIFDRRVHEFVMNFENR